MYFASSIREARMASCGLTLSAAPGFVERIRACSCPPRAASGSASATAVISALVGLGSASLADEEEEICARGGRKDCCAGWICIDCKLEEHGVSNIVANL